MPWPTNVDYSEAIQNPLTAFADPDLRSGRVERTVLGPKARSGNMATVYRVETRTGLHAVRVFTKPNPESTLRYSEIQSHFARNPLPYMVGFQFIPRGIRVGPQWYPIVKMQWMEGIPLPDFIKNNLLAPGNLRKLATEWVAMLAALRGAGIAHGDLQHGNVLLVQGRLRLVDYDGCYVPGLRGKPATELGHLNYQHPKRSATDFEPHLDNFSAWLIYLSIIATAGRPALWKELGGGDECLLFRKGDLQLPQRSEAFHFLSKHPDERVRALSQKVRSFLNLDLARIPPVFDYLTSPEAAELRVSPLITAKIWLDDHLDFSSRLETFQRNAAWFFRKLPGWLWVAAKFVGRWALRIAIFLSIMLWRFLVWFFRFLGRLFLAAVDRWGIGQVMLTIGGFILGTALLFQLWSCVHRPAARDVSQNSPKMYFVPQALLGRWTGSGLSSQANRGKIQVQVALGQRYMSRIVGTSCLATLSLVNATPQSATFVEHFQQPGPLCVDDTISLEYRGLGHLHFWKVGTGGTWQGELWRMQVTPRRNK